MVFSMAKPIRSLDRRAFLCCGAASSVAALRARLVHAVQMNEGGLLAPRPTHFPARCQRLLFIFLTGGFSHVDTFDHKPALVKDRGRELSTRQLRGSPAAKLMPSPFKFTRYGQCG